MAQQFVIMAREGDGATPLGTRGEVIDPLASMNTMAEEVGEDVLWGPGIRIDLPPEQDPVTQMLLGIVEEEIAWLVIMRLGSECNWRIIDMETGQELEPE